jgi:glutaredoxin
MRLLMVAVVITVIFVLFYSSGMEPETDVSFKDFYEKTKDAMERGTARGQAVINSKTGEKAGHIPADKDGDGDIDNDDKVAAQELQERLQAVAQEAKDKANEKSPKPDIPSKIVGVGSSAEGQVKKGQAKVGGDVGERVKSDTTKEETKEEHEAEVEMSSILKKSPGKQSLFSHYHSVILVSLVANLYARDLVIIFSKSYCPYSKRAKGILLEKYAITPEPFVVELDEHPIGSNLQDYLLKKTGRRTVPNILINGVSIGGADDIVALDNEDKLVAKVRDLGQARVEIAQRFTAGAHQ